jgi:hypothetical protein
MPADRKLARGRLPRETLSALASWRLRVGTRGRHAGSRGLWLKRNDPALEVLVTRQGECQCVRFGSGSDENSHSIECPIGTQRRRGENWFLVSVRESQGECIGVGSILECAHLHGEPRRRLFLSVRRRFRLVTSRGGHRRRWLEFRLAPTSWSTQHCEENHSEPVRRRHRSHHSRPSLHQQEASTRLSHRMFDSSPLPRVRLIGAIVAPRRAQVNRKSPCGRLASRLHGRHDSTVAKRGLSPRRARPGTRGTRSPRCAGRRDICCITTWSRQRRAILTRRKNLACVGCANA